MIELREVNDENKYYERLNVGVMISTMWSTLQTKSEYGSNKSEKGYQLLAQSMARIIARELNANEDLSQVLTMCKGAFFPVKGKEGKKCIMEYMKNHNLEMSEADLARNFVEYDLFQSGNTITPKFDQLLKELFNEEHEANALEVQIARLCNKSVEEMKQIERYSNIKSVDLLYKLSEDVEKESIKAGKPTPSRKLEEMLKTVPVKEEEISEEDKKQIFRDLDEFIEYTKGNIMTGIYEYIGSDDLDER